MTLGKRLREIVIVVPWQASEAVENFLMESGALGVSIERLAPEGLAETVHGYFSEDRPAGRLEASAQVYLNAIKSYFPSSVEWHFHVRLLRDQDWEEQWKTFFKPLRVSQRVVIKPTWDSYRARRGDIVIDIDPGRAFGTGLHATTRLCLNAIERQVNQKRRQDLGKGAQELSLLDMGTGSGILAILAAKMGASRVVGIDIDRTAVEVARQNVTRNHVNRVVQVGSETIETLPGCFDFVVANIDFPTLSESSAKLTSWLCQGGRLILSGILEEERGKLQALFLIQGLQLIEETSREGWNCQVFQRP